ncbi:MAG: septation protein A [Hyphomicrobiaceae bacterium]
MSDNKPVNDSKAATANAEVSPQQLQKMALDLGPVLIFFVTYFVAGIYWATGLIMVATVISMIMSRLLLGHISVTLLMTTALVVGFGGLTLWFNDPSFIKMKPTIINLLFAAVLFGGVLFGRPLLRYLLGEVVNLTEQGWRLLSIRYGLFFLAMAGMNEVVWRNFSEAFWVNFKFFGFPVMTIAFFVAQQALLTAHKQDSAKTEDN